jgi:hypothetical protein
MGKADSRETESAVEYRSFYFPKKISEKAPFSNDNCKGGMVLPERDRASVARRYISQGRYGHLVKGLFCFAAP